MIGSEEVNELKKILYNCLSKDVINILGMQYKMEDAQWMIKKGYQENFEIGKNSIMRGGGITREGTQFFDYYEKELNKVMPKIEKELTFENERKTSNLIRDYVKKNKNKNYSPDSEIYSGMTENEKYAFAYFARNPMDIGHR